MIRGDLLTLIVGFANARYAGLVADGRISAGGVALSDEFNKLAVAVFRDARVAIGLTGLAEFRDFNTRRVLLAALLDSLEPDFTLARTVARLAPRLTQEFERLPIDRKHKLLTVVVAGFLYDQRLTPLSCVASISNFERGLSRGECVRLPLPEHFDGEWMVQSRLAAPETVGLLLRAGATDASKKSDVLKLREGLLAVDRPAEAVVGPAVELIRSAARSPRSNSAIGLQCGSIVVPSAVDEPPREEYHTSKATHRINYVSRVECRGGDFGAYVLDSPFQEVRGPEAEPIAVPKVGRNAPCPCRSGKKYKHCHGG